MNPEKADTPPKKSFPRIVCGERGERVGKLDWAGCQIAAHNTSFDIMSEDMPEEQRMPGFFQPVSPAGGPAHAKEVGHLLDRMRTLAHRMLSLHPSLRGAEGTSDLVQNAVIRLDNAMQSEDLASPRNVIGLAVTQLKRELVDLIRRHQIRERWATIAALELEAQASEDRSLDTWTQFHEAVEGLPREQRDAVQFLWYLGLDQETAAASLGICSRTLRRHWREGQKSLRKALPDFRFD